MNAQPDAQCDLPKLDSFLDDSLSDQETPGMIEHLETCESCRLYLESTAAESSAWSDASEFLKTDLFDDERFLTTTNAGISQRKSRSSAIEAITSQFTPSEFPGRLGRIGIYEVTGIIGSGATGVVFRAIDPSLDRTVAIKILMPSLTSSGAASKRFEREAKAAAAVIHPNVVPIHGVSNSQQLSYLVMAYAGGESLQKRLSTKGPLELPEILRIGSQIAAGLAAAHGQGLVHRDIKPANIIIEDNVERIAITDFGLARAVDDASLTTEGIIAGTPRYMSPEQSKGESVTQLTDLFSLGSVLYAISTGRPPFRAESSYGVMRKICDDEATPVQELNPAIPDWLANTINKLMSKDPANRFQSASEVSELLERALAHVQQPLEIPLPHELKLLKKQSRRSFSFYAKAIAMFTLFLAVLGSFLIQENAIPKWIQTPFNSTRRDYPREALFHGAFVYDKDGTRTLNVMHEDKWYVAETIGGTPVASIFEYGDLNLHPGDIERRIIEDLPVVLQMMGNELKAKCDVELVDAKGKTQTFNVELTKAKRRSLMDSGSVHLTPEMFATELESFKSGLEKQFAYYRTNDVDLDFAIEVLKHRYPEGIQGFAFAKEIQVLLAKFIDGHAGVDFRSHLTQALPFLLEPVDQRFVAFYEDRESFLDAEFPFIVSIDGVKIKKLIQPFKPAIAKGSPQFVLRQQLRMLRNLGEARKLVGLPLKDMIEIKLANEDGKTKDTRLFVSDRTPYYGHWPMRPRTGIIEKNLGYLRIHQMNSESKDLIRTWMPRFKETDGLIVDVRDNGGGSRASLIELSKHLMSDTDTPRIANVCKYRLFEEFRPGHLDSRFAFPNRAGAFNNRERDAIDEFMKTFKPQWAPPNDEFSQWHFLVLSKDKDDPRKTYTKPVVILMNEKCFSATDIFLGAFKNWPNVTLVGRPSGGGSAKTEEFELPISKLEIECASMASFQPNGKLYDSNGVEPDILVSPTAKSFVRGGDDPFLKKAIELLTKKNEQQ